MLECNSPNVGRYLLYLDSRELPCERNAELRAALDIGYSIIMATPNPEAYRSYALAHVIPANVGKYDEAAHVILAYLREHALEVSGIIAWKDREVELVARLGERLGLPCSSVEATRNVRNKVLTRQVLDSVEGANPRYCPISNESEFIAALDVVGLPALLKPAGNSGSRGIRRVTSRDNALDVYREFIEYSAGQSGEMFHYYDEVALLEQEIVGSEHSMAGLVSGGEVITLAIADKRFDRELLLQYQNTVPSSLPDPIQQQIVSLVKRAVRATGIDHCGFHVDIMVTADGVKLLEIGGRLGGELINSHLVPLAQPGLSPYQALLEVVQGRNPLAKSDYTRDFSSSAASRVVMPPGYGTVSKVTGVEKVRRDPHCRDFMQLYGVGDSMVPPEERFKSYEIGYIIAQCASDEDMDVVLDELCSRIVITLD